VPINLIFLNSVQLQIGHTQKYNTTLERLAIDVQKVKDQIKKTT